MNAESDFETVKSIMACSHVLNESNNPNQSFVVAAIQESSNEDARFVLPGACETRLMVTMNARELRHFFSLRMCSRAQWEIRELATRMHALCMKTAPELFADAGPGCVRGHCPEGEKSCGKPWKRYQQET